MSDTPRTDEQINGKPCTRFAILAGDSLRNAVVQSEFARQLERELNAANSIIRQQQLLDEENLRLQERIKRLESAGDALEYASVISEAGEDPNGFEKLLIAQREWRKAKEAKP
jgi:hypothetical protein